MSSERRTFNCADSYVCSVSPGELTRFQSFTSCPNFRLVDVRCRWFHCVQILQTSLSDKLMKMTSPGTSCTVSCRTQDLRNNLACQLLLSLERKTNPEISRACCFCRKAWKSLHIEPSAARCVQGWRCEWPKLNFKDSYLSVQGWRHTIHATPCCLDEFDQSRKVLAAVSEARRAP